MLLVLASVCRGCYYALGISAASLFRFSELSRFIVNRLLLFYGIVYYYCSDLSSLRLDVDYFIMFYVCVDSLLVFCSLSSNLSSWIVSLAITLCCCCFIIV